MTKYQEMELVLEALVDNYVANKGTNSEFITCITPENRMSKTWLLWSKAMEVLKRKK